MKLLCLSQGHNTGYLLFSGDDLLDGLLRDDRFETDEPEVGFIAGVSIVRKKGMDE